MLSSLHTLNVTNYNTKKMLITKPEEFNNIRYKHGTNTHTKKM